MSTSFPGRIRPTFDLAVGPTPDEAAARLTAALAAAREAYPYQVRGRHLVVTVAPGTRHFWSPWLTLEFQCDGGSCLARGRFSPKPTIWTAFMLSYIALLTSGSFAMMFAASMLLIGEAPAAWILLAIALYGSALGLYLASQAGQRLAVEQMRELRGFVEASLCPIGPDP
ncbi:MAG: hypothetical protein IPJ41_10385 [Phycisphaerales bacterium]|nr:hypothetical protein [Phycisphaerales bacterium]